jgi:hypothetical protein
VRWNCTLMRYPTLVGGCRRQPAARCTDAIRKCLHDTIIRTSLKQGHPAATDSAPGPAGLEIPPTAMGVQCWLQGRRTVTHEG